MHLNHASSHPLNRYCLHAQRRIHNAHRGAVRCGHALRINRLVAHIVPLVVARQQRAEPHTIRGRVPHHRTAHVAVPLLHQLREVAVIGVRAGGWHTETPHDRHIGQSMLGKPLVQQLINGRCVVDERVRRRNVRDILAGERIACGGAALVVSHLAGACIEAGHIGQIGVPVLCGCNWRKRSFLYSLAIHVLQCLDLPFAACLTPTRSWPAARRRPAVDTGCA